MNIISERENIARGLRTPRTGQNFLSRLRTFFPSLVKSADIPSQNRMAGHMAGGKIRNKKNIYNIFKKIVP